MTKKIVLVSSGQPSLNPRLVKEADALSNAGYEVTVLYAYWNEWGTAYDKQLLLTKQWTAIRIGGSPAHKRVTYFLSRLIYALSHLTFHKIKAINYLAEYTLSRGSFFLIRDVKKYKADLYIGHNLGALPAVVLAAKKHNKPCGFDAEDFHRHETSNDSSDQDVALKIFIENKYIPQVNYFTASSPQIAQAYQQLFPALKPVVLLNAFPKSAFTEPHNGKRPLKLFWFSQTIGAHRGIEDIVKALQLLNKPDIELHLLGNQPQHSKNFIEAIGNSNITIRFYDPIPPDDIISFASQFDIGLALEPGFCINNNLALSNKLFAYLQAGLAVVASNTTAQLEFMSTNPQIGNTYQIGNEEALTAVLLDYYQHPGKLMACRRASLNLAQHPCNWEVESLKFLETVKHTLAAN